MSKIICIDFDGVLHAYTSPWTNEWTISDGPVPGALEWLAKASKWKDYRLMVYSSRSKSEKGIIAMRAWLISSLEEAGMRSSEVLISFVAEKPAAFITIDDRGFHFVGTFPDKAFLDTFIPWNKS